MAASKKLTPEIITLLHQGTVIPAHPLALHPDLILDEARQRQLTQYYIASGAGGIAVGVHTTQFEIRQPRFGLLDNVLSTAAEEIEQARLTRPFIKVAGICGPTEQAVAEARLAVKYDYHLGLISMGGLSDQSEVQLVQRAIAIAKVIPVFGMDKDIIVDTRRTILVIIDMQSKPIYCNTALKLTRLRVDFFLHPARNPSPVGRNLVPATINMINAFRKNGMKVVWTDVSLHQYHVA